MLILIFLLLAFFNGQSYGLTYGASNASVTTGWIKMLDCKTTENIQGAIVPINTCIHAPTTSIGGKAVKYINVAWHNDTDADNHDMYSYQIATYYTSDCIEANPISVSTTYYAATRSVSDACVPATSNGFSSISHRITILTTAAQVKADLEGFASSGVVERCVIFYLSNT